jgi:hypothetical protein
MICYKAKASVHLCENLGALCGKNYNLTHRICPIIKLKQFLTYH